MDLPSGVKNEILTFRGLKTFITCRKALYTEPVVERPQAPDNAFAGECFFINHPHGNQ
jgi:hypothetical protein